MTERSIRVFISSTFRDMQAEREELVKRVFPELRRRCEQRGVTWGEVDLRWGVTDEEKAEGAVLPICLAEIERSRPYFIGLLGERYGWVPDEVDGELRDQHGWLGDADGRSVTELEILHGVLNDPAMAGHAYFYLRDPAWVERLPPGEREAFVEQATPDEIAALGAQAAEARAAERRRRLAALKQRLRTSGFPVRDGYPEPVALGELVLADLGAMVDELFPAGEPVDPRASENEAHAAFAARRASQRVGRAGDLAALDALVVAAPALVVGPPGGGTSTALAAWSARAGEVVVAHYVGASAAASDWAAMLHRLVGELSDRAQMRIDLDALPAEGDGLKAVFADTLRRAAVVAPIVLVLDGIDELDDRDFARQLSWMPWTLPSGVKVVASASASSVETIEAALARGWRTFDLAPLAVDARRELVAGFLALYAKRLSGDLTERLVASPLAGNPLFLRAVSDELRQHGDHFTLGAALDRYLGAATVDDVFERVLDRWEHDFERDRPGLVRDAVTALWAARRGLSESELLDVLGDAGQPLPHAVWSPLRLAAGEAIAERAGLLALAHEPIRTAVADRYLADGAARADAHRRLADYWAARDLSPRVVDELAWQLRTAGEWGRLIALLIEPGYLVAAYRSDLAELRRGWAALEARGRRMSDGYRAVIDNPAAHADVAWEVARLLTDAGYSAEALGLHQFCVDDARAGGSPARLAAALANLAAAHLVRSELDPAEAVLAEQVAIARSLGDDALLQAALGNQAVAARSRGDRARALALHAEEEAICRRLGDLVGLQASVGNQGTVAFDARDFGRALELFGQQERICREIGDGRLIAGALSAQAQVMAERGDTDGALGLLARQEHELRQFGDVGGLATNLGNRAAIYRQLGRLDEADELAAQEVDLARRAGNRASEARALMVRATIAHQRGDRHAARDLLDAHEALVVATGDRGGLAMNRGERATLAREAGQIGSSRALHAEEEQLYREVGDVTGIATSLGNQALVHHVAGDPACAVAKITEQEQLLRPLGLPGMLQTCLANKAAILLAAGDAAGAEATLAEQEAICRSIGNRAGLAAALGSRAQLALQRGDLVGAIGFLDQQLGEAMGAQASAMVVENLVAQAKLRIAAGDAAGLQRGVAATEQAARAAGDGYVLAQCLAQRGTLVMGTHGAAALLREAETLARTSGNMHALQLSLGNRGLLQLQQGHAPAAETSLREQVQVCRAHNIADGLSAALGNLAIARQQQGDAAGAIELLTEQESLCRAHGDAQGLVLALANRGEVIARLPGRRDEGLALLDHAAATAQQIGWHAMLGPIQQLAAQLRGHG